VVEGGVDEQAIAEYAAQLRQPGHTRASFEYFRTMHADVAETIHHRAKTLTIPVLAMGAEGTMGQMVRDQVVNYANNVTGDIAPTGHWVAEEDPAYLTARLLDFLSDDHASPDAQNAMATARNAERARGDLGLRSPPAAPADPCGRRRRDEAQDRATGSGPANPYHAAPVTSRVAATVLILAGAPGRAAGRSRRSRVPPEAAAAA
jgi:hypothetical protein